MGLPDSGSRISVRYLKHKQSSYLMASRPGNDPIPPALFWGLSTDAQGHLWRRVLEVNGKRGWRQHPGGAPREFLSPPRAGLLAVTLRDPVDVAGGCGGGEFTVTSP